MNILFLGKRFKTEWAVSALKILNAYSPTEERERHTLECGEDGRDVVEIIVYRVQTPLQTAYGELHTGYIVKLYDSHYLPDGFLEEECTLPREVLEELCGFHGKVGFGILQGKWGEDGNFNAVPDCASGKFGFFAQEQCTCPTNWDDGDFTKPCPIHKAFTTKRPVVGIEPDRGIYWENREEQLNELG